MVTTYQKGEKEIWQIFAFLLTFVLNHNNSNYDLTRISNLPI